MFRRRVVVNICAGTQQKHLCNLTSSAETEHSCKMCCRRKDGTCSPFVQADGSFLFLRRGKPCTVGFCDEGVSSSSITPASICSVSVLSFLASSPLAPPFLTGEVHEAGAGRDREVVGFHWQAGHQYLWWVTDGQRPWTRRGASCFLTTNSSTRKVPGWQHRGLRGGVFPHLLDSPQHPRPLCGKTCSTWIPPDANCC